MYDNANFGLGELAEKKWSEASVYGTLFSNKERYFRSPLLIAIGVDISVGRRTP